MVTHVVFGVTHVELHTCTVFCSRQGQQEQEQQQQEQQHQNATSTIKIQHEKLVVEHV